MSKSPPSNPAVLIQFSCQRCGRAYELPDSAAGKKAKCECGEMLTVPIEASEPPPTPQAKRPPRTLAEAAKQAKDAKASPIRDDVLAAMVADEGSPPRKDREHAPQSQIDNQLPPSDEESDSNSQESNGGDFPDLETGDTHQGVVKYRKLREIAAALRLFAYVIYFLAAIFSGLIAYFTLDIHGQSVSVDFSDAMVSGVFILSVWIGAYLLGLLLNAIAEFLHVVMDIEENTRKS